jgi:hypothetical protein
VGGERPAGDVADGPDPVDRRTSPIVGGDAGRRGDDAGVGEPEPVESRPSADGHQHVIDALDGDAVREVGGGAVEPLDGGPRMEPDALRPQRALDDLGDRFVLGSEQAILQFDDVDPGAERRECGGHLDRDRAATDDQECRRRCPEVEQFFVGDDPIRVEAVDVDRDRP